MAKNFIANLNQDREKRKLDQSTLISVVAPVYNEASVVETFVGEIVGVLRELPGTPHSELILVNDGSTDGSGEIMDQMAEQYNGRLRTVHLSRNFGHSHAVRAGLDQAKGHVIILIDSDMQDDPKAFKLFLGKWLEGFDVVYAIRVGRRENLALRFLFWGFYRLLNLVSEFPLPMDSGNYSLIDRKVLEVLREMGETNPYFPGLRAWVGFRQIGVEVPRRCRYDDKCRVNFISKLRLAMNAIFSSSMVPIKLFRFFGIIAIFSSFALLSYALYHKLFTGLAVPHWASQFVVTTFFGGINLLAIGILSEYVGLIYREVQNRPKYIIDRIHE